MVRKVDRHGLGSHGAYSLVEKPDHEIITLMVSTV